MNIIAWLESELANYDYAVQCFNHYTMRTSSDLLGDSQSQVILYWSQGFFPRNFMVKSNQEILWFQVTKQFYD